MSNQPNDPSRDDPNQTPKGQINPSPFNNPNVQRAILILGVIVIFMFFFLLLNRTPSSGNIVSLNELADAVENGQVAIITERGGSDLYITYQNGGTATSYKTPGTDLLKTLGIENIKNANFQ